jgi:cytochrome c-type biogenesis protein CcmF
VKVSVGEPFFNRMAVPAMVALIFLMGVGPSLPWGSTTWEDARKRLVPPSIGALFMAAIAIGAGARSVYAILAFAFTGYAAFGNLREYWIGMRARRKAHGESWPVALFRLVRGNGRRYGGYVAHIGALLVAIGITASATFRTEKEATLVPGQSLTVSGKTVRLKGVWGRDEPQRSVIGATLDVMRKDGSVAGTIEPRLNFYKVSDQPVPTPDVHSSIRGDLYANLMAFDNNGANATVKIIVEPLVPWIWFGGLVMVIGAVIGMFYGGRRRAVIGMRAPADVVPLTPTEPEEVKAAS